LDPCSLLTACRDKFRRDDKHKERTTEAQFFIKAPKGRQTPIISIKCTLSPPKHHNQIFA
ncbi:hypothetical protein KA005_22535, partial [bacterium]|nr:hypothetical protein [bacterium]